jgi:hypothetical protein
MDRSKKPKEDKRDTRRYSNFIVGLGLGAVGVVILSSLLKPRCPKCRKKVLRGIQDCPFCGANLQ